MYARWSERGALGARPLRVGVGRRPRSETLRYFFSDPGFLRLKKIRSARPVPRARPCSCMYQLLLSLHCLISLTRAHYWTGY